MNLKHTLQTIGLSAIALGVPVAASCQTYQFSEPINGWMSVSLTDRPSGISSEYHAQFKSLSETIYLDLNAKTIREVGTIKLSSRGSGFVFNEDQATVNLTAEPAGGVVSFDTGLRTLTPISGGYSFDGNIGDLAMTGSYSISVNNGQVFNGPLNYVMHQTVDPAWTFNRVLTGGAPGSITLSGLGNYGGAAYYYEEDVLASITAANGFSMQVVSGSNVVPGYGPGDMFVWSSGSVTALAVPEPASLSLVSLGLFGLALVRRQNLKK